MNFLALYTELTSTAYGRFAAEQLPLVKNALGRLAYEEIWNAAEWQFKRVQTAPFAITSGTPAMPADFAKSLQLFDDLGEELEPMNSEEFEGTYRYSITNNITGRPEAFKVVNRQITVAPTPNVTYNGFISYYRRLSYYTAGGVATPGFMSLDTDIPLWPNFGSEDYHYVLVPVAMKYLLATETDYYSRQMVEAQSASALAAMVEELAGVDVGAGNRSFGADNL